MAIKKPSELNFAGKNYIMILAGRPGVGKTTLAESAPSPIVIDLEDGIARVEACYRGDTSTADDTMSDIEKYNAFIEDLKSPDMAQYKTIVIDSLGKLIDLLTPVVIKESPANAQKDGKTLSMKGYGAIKTKVKEFQKLIASLHKNLIYVVHVTEFQDGDVTKTRINVAGSTKDSIWDDADIGGYIEFVGKNRVIHFSPSEKWDAKGTHGISGTYDIPELKSSKDGGSAKDNHFITDLFNTMTQNLIDEQKYIADGETLYNEAMKLAPKIEAVTNVDELNAVLAELKAAKHGLTSQKELQSKFKKKVDELGATYDKDSKQYTIKA